MINYSCSIWLLHFCDMWVVLGRCEGVVIIELVAPPEWQPIIIICIPRLKKYQKNSFIHFLYGLLRWSWWSKKIWFHPILNTKQYGYFLVQGLRFSTAGSPMTASRRPKCEDLFKAVYLSELRSASFKEAS